MTDYSELKRLAEASRAANHDELGPDEAFQEALHPEVVMALIAENERYRQYGCDTCDGSGHLHRIDGEYYGACTSCGAHEFEKAKRERDQLKSESERLRAALAEAKYRIEQGRVWAGTKWQLTGLHTLGQQKALDVIDAALGQGEQSGG